jgi:hypothetical protein
MVIAGSEIFLPARRCNSIERQNKIVADATDNIDQVSTICQSRLWKQHNYPQNMWHTPLGVEKRRKPDLTTASTHLFMH